MTYTETGRLFISPCCTAASVEYADENGKLYTRYRVAGHGWQSEYVAGSVDDINDTGTITEADGTERKVHFREPKPVCKGCGSELLYSDASAYCADCETEGIVSSFAPVGCDPESRAQ